MVQEFLSPDVTGIEVNPASAPAALSPAIAAMVGWTDKGPANSPIRVRGPEEFVRRFGDINNTGILALAARAFFGNGGQDLVVVRVTPSDAVAATIDVDAPAKWTFTARGAGTWGNDLAVLIRGNSGYLDRTTGSYTRYDVLVIQPFDFDPSIEVAAEVYEAVQFDDPLAVSYFSDVINDDRSPSQLIDVIVGLGGTPDDLVGSTITGEIAVATAAAVLNQTGTLASPPVLDLTLRLEAEGTPVVDENIGIGVGSVLDLSTLTNLASAPIKPGSLNLTYNAGTGPVRTITDDSAGNLVGDVDPGGTIDYTTGALTGDTSVPAFAGVGDDFEADYIPVQRVTDDGLGNLIGDVDAGGANTINYETGEFDVDFAAAPVAATDILAYYRSLPTEVRFDLVGGLDGTSVGRSVVSDPSLEASKLGLYALNNFEEPLNVVLPDFEGSTLVQRDLLAYAQSRQDRFAILGMSDAATVPEVVQYVLTTQAGYFDKRFAAFYYPNVRYVRQDTNTVETVPVTAFVAGVYARTAKNKNIGKSPAGVEDGAINAPGVVGPEIDLQDKTLRDILYQARINPVFRSLATGYAVWGDRTLSLEARWRNANARLLHNFLMFRIRRLLMVQVFENNGPGLWSLVEQSVKGFMESLYEQGFFTGLTAREAFFVRCDPTNNNAATLAARKVFVDVGFSPNTPAEFIIFRLQQPVTIDPGV